MDTLKWNVRTIVTLSVAGLLTALLGAMGVWLLLSGQPGTGMMESGDHSAMMADGDHAGMMATAPVAEHMLGTAANRGVLGGYTGAVGLVMIMTFTAMIGLLLYAVFRERPGSPKPVACWNCERPVESDWPACPYCGAALAGGNRPPQPVGEP